MDNATNANILVEKLEGFWKWASNDSNVVGINPWLVWMASVVVSRFHLVDGGRLIDNDACVLTLRLQALEHLGELHSSQPIQDGRQVKHDQIFAENHMHRS